MPEVKAETRGEEDGVSFGSLSCAGRCLFLGTCTSSLDTTKDSEHDGPTAALFLQSAYSRPFLSYWTTTMSLFIKPLRILARSTQRRVHIAVPDGRKNVCLLTKVNSTHDTEYEQYGVLIVCAVTYLSSQGNWASSKSPSVCTY
jgi:hypothetical protein